MNISAIQDHYNSSVTVGKQMHGRRFDKWLISSYRRPECSPGVHKDQAYIVIPANHTLNGVSYMLTWEMTSKELEEFRSQSSFRCIGAEWGKAGKDSLTYSDELYFCESLAVEMSIMKRDGKWDLCVIIKAGELKPAAYRLLDITADCAKEALLEALGNTDYYMELKEIEEEYFGDDKKFVKENAKWFKDQNWEKMQY